MQNKGSILLHLSFRINMYRKIRYGLSVGYYKKVLGCMDPPSSNEKTNKKIIITN